MKIRSNQSIYVDSAEVNTTASFLPCAPLLSSVRAGWEHLFLEYHYQPSGEHEEVCAAGHSIAIFTKVDPGGKAERLVDGILYKHSVAPGDTIILPAQIGVKASWQGSSEFVLVGFHPNIFSHILDEFSVSDRQIVPQLGIPDPLILQMGLALKQALEKNLGNRLYVETMANALFVHLIQNYANNKPVLTEYAKGLGRRKLQQAIDYINSNLDRDLSLSELANLVQLSPHYFALLFKQSTGLTPHQYVIKVRIDRTKQLLQQGKLSIADIAQVVGFANQSHLNLHFKRLVGVTPKKYSRGV
jgi:AraC family transcriptional regulator